MTAGNWNRDFSTAPRDPDIKIVGRIKGGAKELIIDDGGDTFRYRVIGGPDLTLSWDDCDQSKGWTTGGCARLSDDHLEGWRFS